MTTPQEDLQIGVLGHRQAILAAVRSLPRCEAAAERDAACLGELDSSSPESPLRAKQHRQKLLRELEKTEAHAAALNR